MDGVQVEMAFQSAPSNAEIGLLPRTTCIHDGSLEELVVDLSAQAGARGNLVLSVFPGRSALRDDLGFVQAAVVQVT